MLSNPVQDPSGDYVYIIHNIDFELVNEVFIQTHSSGYFDRSERNFLNLQPESLEVNSAVFSGFAILPETPMTTLVLQDNILLCSCLCHSVTNKLCSHQAQALYNVIKRKELRVFFDEKLRTQELRRAAKPYGLEQEDNIERFFDIHFIDGNFAISPSFPGLLSVETDTISELQDNLLSTGERDKLQLKPQKPLFLALRQHRYYKHLLAEVYEADLSQVGKPKNPFKAINVADKVLAAEDADESKFYFGVLKFQNHGQREKSEQLLKALKAVMKNPLNLPIYLHQPEITDNVVASSITTFNLGNPVSKYELSVTKADPFFEVSALIDLGYTRVPVAGITLKLDYFLQYDGKFHPAANLKVLKIIDFFKKHNNKLLIHTSKYEDFLSGVLQKLEHDAEIRYEYLPPASLQQVKDNKLDKPAKRIIYLKDSDPYVELDPVMKYGDSEISILSKRQIYIPGAPRTFHIDRDNDAEIAFAALIMKQHPYLAEQVSEGLPFFYLHKKHFLKEEWFLKTFGEWNEQGIRVMGFNKIKDNKLNPNPAKITVRILSGIDWFNAEIEVKFANKKASLKKVRQAVKNNNRYVALDDGTLGILPQDWIKKFEQFFAVGDLEDDLLKIVKSNFNTITQLFEDEMIDDKVKQEIRFFQEKLSNFESIEEVPVPYALKAELRDYQKQGLNWLNFLDDFNFGGCLADDMGLGKTVQIIAFILSQRIKRKKNTNLIVVPASLIFNWQDEIQKFAPDLKYMVLYGVNRSVDHKIFNDYELILTSYGTLLSDVRYLKGYEFNYVFLDESQNIKNPDSQRYKAACLLKSRNRIVITGTPFENNTFDLFGQLSFACPGLLGNKQYFKDIFLNPIDQFGDGRRTKELKRKIEPFILRRTKAEVLQELPDKTEMIIYCEMGQQQRKIYDAQEKEFREFVCSKTNAEIPKNAIHVLKGLTKLRQVCNSALLLNDDEIPERGSAKIDTLIEHLLEKTSDHKVLVFSQFVSMLDLIKKELSERDILYSYLTGSTKDRSSVVKEFQEDKARKVFLISLKAGGTGLNLIEADYVYLVDPWWNPAVENQAIDRVYRIGQKKNVTAIRLICRDTVEEKMMLMQQEKRDLFETLITTDTGIGKSFTKEGLLKLLNTPLA